MYAIDINMTRINGTIVREVVPGARLVFDETASFLTGSGPVRVRSCVYDAEQPALSDLGLAQVRGAVMKGIAAAFARVCFTE